MGSFTLYGADGAKRVVSGMVGTYVLCGFDEDPPEHTLPCDGAEVSRTSYPLLFNKFGTKYGAGDGATTFNLPDARGMFFRGLDMGRGIDSNRDISVEQGDEFKSHNHGLTSRIVSSGGTYDVAGGEISGGWGNTAYAGGTETRPKNMAAMVCVVYE